MKLRLTPFDALIVVDVQRDFMPGGALPVPEGDKVVAPLNQYIERFSKANLPVFFTRDWHPKDHISFKGHGGIWPPHCVQGNNSERSFKRERDKKDLCGWCSHRLLREKHGPWWHKLGLLCFLAYGRHKGCGCEAR
jgi:hypothetical protein